MRPPVGLVGASAVIGRAVVAERFIGASCLTWASVARASAARVPRRILRDDARQPIVDVVGACRGMERQACIDHGVERLGLAHSLAHGDLSALNEARFDIPRVPIDIAYGGDQVMSPLNVGTKPILTPLMVA